MSHLMGEVCACLTWLCCCSHIPRDLTGTNTMLGLLACFLAGPLADVPWIALHPYLVGVRKALEGVNCTGYHALGGLRKPLEGVSCTGYHALGVSGSLLRLSEAQRGCVKIRIAFLRFSAGWVDVK